MAQLIAKILLNSYHSTIAFWSTKLSNKLPSAPISHWISFSRATLKKMFISEIYSKLTKEVMENKSMTTIITLLGGMLS